MLGLTLAFVSCKKAADAPMVEWTFEAPGTKASLSADGAFSWAPGDQIAVWNSTTNAFVTFSTPTGSGRFTAQAPANAHFTQEAYYPASAATGLGAVLLSSEYSLSDLSSGKGMPMFAAVNDGSNILNFKHLCAFVIISVKDIPAEATQIHISSSTVSLSGEFEILTASGEKIIGAQPGSGSVTIPLSLSQTQDVTFTIPLPVGEYALSCSVQGTSTSVQTDPIAFQRAHLYALSSIDAGGDRFAPACEVYELANDNDNWE